jgi:hypothetical protein
VGGAAEEKTAASWDTGVLLILEDKSGADKRIFFEINIEIK